MSWDSKDKHRLCRQEREEKAFELVEQHSAEVWNDKHMAY